MMMVSPRLGSTRDVDKPGPRSRTGMALDCIVTKLYFLTASLHESPQISDAYEGTVSLSLNDPFHSVAFCITLHVAVTCFPALCVCASRSGRSRSHRWPIIVQQASLSSLLGDTISRERFCMPAIDDRGRSSRSTGSQIATPR